MAALPATPPGLPTGPELLERERLVRHGGTGLQATDLEGSWLLDQVWPKGSDRPSSFSAALLRGLAARLEIGRDGDALAMGNAVRLGALELRFRGPGRLVGARPLLEFRFDSLELSLAGRTLLRRSLAGAGVQTDALLRPDRPWPGGLACRAGARRRAGALAARGRGSARQGAGLSGSEAERRHGPWTLPEAHRRPCPAGGSRTLTWA